MYISNKIKKVLTEDDLKVIKHLTAIDNIFKKGNTSVRLFSGPCRIYVTTVKDDQEYELFSFGNIPHDGGDPDWGLGGYGTIASPEDFIATLEDDDDEDID